MREVLSLAADNQTPKARRARLLPKRPMTEKSPTKIARETLQQLVERKLPPTPGNYQAIYNELAGIPWVEPFPEGPLRRIAEELPARNPGQEKQKSLLGYAVSQRNWQGVHDALMAHAGFGGVQAPAGAATVPARPPEFTEQVARQIEIILSTLDMDDARLQEQAGQLVRALRDAGSDALTLRTQLADFNHRLSFAAEEQKEIRATLLKLLHLIIENIHELSLDEHWLRGQAEALMTAATPPLTLRRLDDVERRLKDVIFKQSEAKGRAHEAQEELRGMLAAFFERLSKMTLSSDGFHQKMEEGAQQIEQAQGIAEIGPALKGLVSAARDMAQESHDVRDELRAMKDKTQATQAEMERLHQELDRVSAQARHDKLTGVLNRKGLDEAMRREISIMQRREAPLCVALLDIDDFKKFNDTRGHAAGDAALAHLAAVVRASLRPQDALARYGGEEFVILLPDTLMDKGIETMVRLQRELSRRYFLDGGEQVLITFSAGVTQLASDEPGEQAIARADKAMYLAKRAGKNRVLGA